MLWHRRTVKIVIVSIVSLEGVRSIDASRGKLRSVFFPEDGGNSCKIIAFCRSFPFQHRNILNHDGRSKLR